MFIQFFIQILCSIFELDVVEICSVYCVKVNTYLISTTLFQLKIQDSEVFFDLVNFVPSQIRYNETGRACTLV